MHRFHDVAAAGKDALIYAGRGLVRFLNMSWIVGELCSHSTNYNLDGRHSIHFWALLSPLKLLMLKKFQVLEITLGE